MFSHTSIHFLLLRWDTKIHTHIQTTVKNTVPRHSRNDEFLPGNARGLLVEKFRPWSRVRARYLYELKEWKLKTKAFFHTDRKETTFVRAPKFDPTIIENNIRVRETSGFHRRVDEICPLLGLYIGQNGSFLPMFRDNLWVPFSRVKQSFLDCLNLEDGTDSFPRNVRNKLPFYAAIYAFMECVWRTAPPSCLLHLLLKYRPYADTASSHGIVTMLVVVHLQHFTRQVQ
jgi:hypothetical protein